MQTTPAPLLCVDGCAVDFDGVAGLDGFSLTADAGDVVAVLGPLGSGKSTLLATIAGLHAPSRGRVEVDGARADGSTPDAMARRGVVLVPAVGGVFPSLTVAENLRLSLPRAGRIDTPRVRHLMRRFPILETRLRQTGGTLSGGEQRQLAVARGVLREPRLLLLDEPLLGLAPDIAHEVVELVRDVAASGCAVVLCEERPTPLLEQAVTRQLGIRNGRNTGIGEEVSLAGRRQELDRHRAVLEAVHPERVSIPLSLRDKRRLQTLADSRGEPVGELLAGLVKDLLARPPEEVRR